MITWPESMLHVVGLFDHCKSIVGAWVVTPSCIGFVCHRGSTDGSLRPLCRDCGCFP
jgi:hypothetical protein